MERLATGALWSEGPVYLREDDSVIWSDIPNNRLLRWSAKDGMTIWREPSNFENGHYRDLEGQLLSCEQWWSLHQPDRARRPQDNARGSLSGKALEFPE